MSAVRTERGWAGHFICASGCLFRRNTLLECGDVRVVVSTVGNYNRLDGRGPEEIGADRHYETLAFHAKWEAPYWEADVEREVWFPMPYSVHGVTRDSDAKANDMHERIVAEIAARMESGKDLEEQ